MSHIGLELPIPNHAGPDAQALLYYGGKLIHCCDAATGRLLRPRHLAREVVALVQRHLARSRKEAEAIRLRSALLAQLHVADALLWAKRIQREHLTSHTLRLRHTEHLHCRRLPPSFLGALIAQLGDDIDATPPHKRLSVVFVIPVAPRLRLLDKVCVYLGATLRKRQPVHWACCWHERVSAMIGPGAVLVRVE